MIGESSGVTTLINNERITRENRVQGDSQSRESTDQDDFQQGGVSDTASFSTEALALARNVVPVTESAAQGDTEGQGRGQGEDDTSAPRFLDIRA